VTRLLAAAALMAFSGTVPGPSDIIRVAIVENARVVEFRGLDIEIAALGAMRTQLSMSARYRPPLGMIGRALDKALMHRVAEATVKDFLDRVGERLALRSGAPR